MEQYVIKGCNPLVGEVEIAGAKNAALAILAAAISRRSELPTICWEHFLVSTNMQKYRFRADAISEAVRSISI